MATDLQALDLSDTVVTGRRRDVERGPMEVTSQQNNKWFPTSQRMAIWSRNVSSSHNSSRRKMLEFGVVRV